MPSQIVPFVRSVNGISIEQRRTDGFINATAMAVAHGKRISDWLRLDDTLELFEALAFDLGMNSNYDFYRNSTTSRLSVNFPDLVFVKRGAPETGGGTWIHPDLAVPLASWCNKPFAIQVGRWVREWIVAAQSPVSVDEEITQWMQRHDMRVFLKDVLRPELMQLTVAYALSSGENPRTLCQNVHDTMNERIQGYKSQELKTFGGLPIASLLRDHLGAESLVLYSAINKLAKNAIEDKKLHPVSAVHYACDNFLGKKYIPEPAQIQENVYSQGKRLKNKKRRKLKSSNCQLNLFEDF